MKIAVIGTGLIGRSWSMVFARAGLDVSIWDSHPAAADAALDFIGRRLPELAELGLLHDRSPETVLAAIKPAASLAECLDGAAHVQENGPERVADKTTLFAELDRLAAPETVLASSTTAIRASAFTEALPGRGRCLVAHPVNPPYLIPLVELSPAPWTTPETVARTKALMEQAGMVPAVLKREIDGFILNRLQAALIAEGMSLVETGIADPSDIDNTVKHGLGLRWSFMGPFETIDLNAPGGLRDYVERYGPGFSDMMAHSTTPSWSGAAIERLHADRREAVPEAEHKARQEWRDRRLMALMAHKVTQPD
jgi:L-gulonate 3-dehydrogenase